MSAESGTTRLSRTKVSRPSALWVSWRMQRAGLAALLGFGAAIAVFILLSGRQFHHAYQTLLSNGCASGSNSESCGNAQSILFQHSEFPNIVTVLVVLFPFAAGAFLAAPLLSREFESGTFRFVWAQGTGTRRWLVTNMAVASLVVASGACVLGILNIWYAEPFTSVGLTSDWQSSLFQSTAVTLPGLSVLAVATGTLCGALLRRVVPSIAVAAVTLAVMAGLAYWKLGTGFSSILARTVHGSPQALGSAFGSPRPVAGPGRTWILNQWLTGAGGSRVNLQAALSSQSYPSAQSMARWFAAHHLTLWWSYQPGDRLWMLQSLELAGAIALAAAAVMLTARWIERRVA